MNVARLPGVLIGYSWWAHGGYRSGSGIQFSPVNMPPTVMHHV